MQPPKRFQAPTIEEAYGLVREELGDEAIIMATRSATAPSFMGAAPREFVEVTACLPDGVSPPERRPMVDAVPSAPVAPIAPELRRPFAPEPEPAPARIQPGAAYEDFPRALPFTNDVAVSGRANPALIRRLQGRIESTLRQARDAEVPAPEALDVRELDDGPAAAWEPAAATAHESPATTAVAEQLSEMRRMLEELNLARVNDRLGDRSPALRAARRRLFEQGLGASVLLPLLDEVADSISASADTSGVLQTLERKLATRLPAPVRLGFSRRPAAVFLVGPAGAGKTTMAIRLALEVERTYRLRVAIAGTDVHRVGGTQQLAAIGAATSIPVRLCYTPGELQALLSEGSTDVVIVDTPGHSGTRRDRMTELAAFTQVAHNRTVLLTLPATMKGQDLAALAGAYRRLGPAGLVVTRCDETGTFGPIFSAACDSGLGVAFTVHSESVSDTPRVGDNRAFARAVVGGAWPEASALPRGREAGRVEA
ncbi:MAG: hypothetical protein GEU80_04245 [Dehalococcoidia bacterium]|nr:hypothetical protein [Dehalococcoidia bacterium]